MKSFAVNNNGDLIINKDIQTVDGDELLRQKIMEVLSTNKGEWFFDWEQGINFSNMLGKGVTEDAVSEEIANGLKQIDESIVVSNFSMSQTGRTLLVNFTATSAETSVEITTEY